MARLNPQERVSMFWTHRGRDASDGLMRFQQLGIVDRQLSVRKEPNWTCRSVEFRDNRVLCVFGRHRGMLPVCVRLPQTAFGAPCKGSAQAVPRA